MTQADVLIIGAGLSGLSCALHLARAGRRVRVLEASDSCGGRIKTDLLDGYRLDHGFQVLQTAYPEAQAILDYSKLDLQSYPRGVAIHLAGRFQILADPRRHPGQLFSTLTSSVGTTKDRLLMARLSLEVGRGSLADLLALPEQTAEQFLVEYGFSEDFRRRFFLPFFAGTTLERSLASSDRVLRYIFRMFANGEAAIPASGMGEIPAQLAATLPPETILYNARVTEVATDGVRLADGREIKGGQLVLATPEPVTRALLGQAANDQQHAVGEVCLYYGTDWQPPLAAPFLVLNGEEKGIINNLAFPSLVAGRYAPAGKTLVAAVVLGRNEHDLAETETLVRQELQEWFGPDVQQWRHLKSYCIDHGLPGQHPPTRNPYQLPEQPAPTLHLCGEATGLPGIQWALQSGRMTAERILGGDFS